MRKLIVILILFIEILPAKAQEKSIDLGIGAGGSFYWGDMTSNNVSQSINPVFSGYFRYTFTPRYAIRVGGGFGSVAGDGNFESTPWSFEKDFWEFNTLFEFYFLEYFTGNEKYPFSPYIMGGLGLMGSSYDLAANASNEAQIPPDPENEDGNFTSLTLPFGLGVSFYLFPKFSLSIEANFRKTTKDGFDDLSNPHGFVANDKIHNNDWINFVGITLNYKLFSKQRPCHAYD